MKKYIIPLICFVGALVFIAFDLKLTILSTIASYLLVGGVMSYLAVKVLKVAK